MLWKCILLMFDCSIVYNTTIVKIPVTLTHVVAINCSIDSLISSLIYQVLKSILKISTNVCTS